MSRIFLSHSSADNAEAVALRDWLKGEGWDDIFLDLDPDRGIAAGDRWERALNEAAHRCEAVVFLVSRAWLGSGWCHKEFILADKLNKRLFGILIEDIPTAELPVDLTGTWQLVRLHPGRDHVTLTATMPISGDEVRIRFSTEGLARLRTGLQRAGLDARFFGWPPESDPTRPPYRGLRPLEAEDAGIFLGRDAAIVEASDRLRGLREGAAPRFFVILGASGAGKSSFLRAGLLPRLARDDKNFLPLPVLRPEHAAISGDNGLVHSLKTAFEQRGISATADNIKTAIAGGTNALVPLLAKLVADAQRWQLPEDRDGKPPILVLPIDQGEEMFAAEGSEEAEQFLTLVRDLVMLESPGLLVLFTIRSDSYERLQTAKSLDGIRQMTLSLPPMPRGSYQAVIEGPPERLRGTPRALKIDPKLTHALLTEIDTSGGRDALPLLAFSLERLYLEYGGRGELTLADYEALGRIKGSIEAAVEQALAATDSDASIPKNRDARLTLLRRSLIPWLAGIDADTGSPRRRVARMSEIPAEGRPLIQALVEQRLLATDAAQDTGETTVEPAHEALLRQWGLLQGWLAEDFGALTTLDATKHAARDWAANNKDPAWLTHTGARLQEAERLRMRDDLARHIEPIEQDYISECRRREDEERQAEQIRLARERRNLRLVRYALIAFFFVVMAALGGALWQMYQTSKREAAVFASQAEIAFRAGLCDRAMRMAVAGLPPSKGASPLSYRSDELESALARYASAQGCPFRLALAGHGGPVFKVSFNKDGTRAVTASADRTARLWDVKIGATIATFEGHKGAVNSAAFSPDDRRIVTASEDGTARLWNAATGELLAALEGHTAPVTSALFSPDGQRVVTASDDHTARLWDANTGTSIATLSGHGRRVRAAIFSPDGTRVVTTSNDQTGRLWNATTGDLIATLSGHKDWVRTAAFNPDGSRIVTTCEDKTARLWNGKTGEPVTVLSGHSGYVVSGEFSPDGSRILTASFDKTARVWDAATGATLAILSGHTGRINNATFSPDGVRVVTASEDRTARLWDSSTGAQLAMFSGHSDAILAARFAPDGSQVVTASVDRTARFWDAEIGIALVTLKGHEGPVQSAVLSAAGDRVATASDDKTARLWDSRTGAQLKILVGHEDWVRTATFSPDGSRVVTASFDNSGRLWDGKTGELIAVLHHTSLVRSAVFSPDGNRVLTVSNDNTAQLWDGKSGAPLATLKGHDDRVYDGVFSPDSRRVATAAYDNARLWDAKTGKQLATMTGHTDRVNNVAFSPDGSRIVTTSEDKTARLWNAANGAAIATLTGHGDATYSATFNPQGTRIATASFDTTARVWDGKTGAALMTLSGHGGPVNTVAFSPDGGRIVTASFDNTARLWDATTGSLMMTFAGHGGPVNSAFFNGDGTRIVTASGDKTARLWDAALARMDPRNEIKHTPSRDRQDYVCRKHLIGVQAFDETEMRDAILFGRDELRNPCERLGWFSIEYYWQFVAHLWK